MRRQSILCGLNHIMEKCSSDSVSDENVFSNLYPMACKSGVEVIFSQVKEPNHILLLLGSEKFYYL